MRSGGNGMWGRGPAQRKNNLKKKKKKKNFPLLYRVAVAQRISSSQWCLRSQDRFYSVLAFYVFSCSISPENSGSVKKPLVQSMYLPRSHTGNIFPSWTVVVRRHHVYVREFHRPSCNSVWQIKSANQRAGGRMVESNQTRGQN